MQLRLLTLAFLELTNEEDNSSEEEIETCFLDDECGITDDLLCVNTKMALNKRPDGMHTALQKDDTQSSITTFLGTPKASHVRPISSTSESSSKPVDGFSTSRHSFEGTVKKTNQLSQKHKTQSTNQLTRKRKTQALSANQSTLTSFFSKTADNCDGFLVGQKEQNDFASYISESLIGPQASQGIQQSAPDLRLSTRMMKIF
ncbi:hypothetical protein OIDMADRAFT_29232 [Oidiodendron maius Zn]|uniref:Uncharacterized protein n=1 Tax=Oidiodendron maius (strain Zn) TaxID=913774 RepID=A0A0C3CMA8_OIDMZ|nr:hypothetical protein OIDMADRAFT_29232 [Oidiodendron maius Zn]